MWDDHDYGINDGDITFPLKDQMQKIYLEMIEEPKDSVRWNQKGLNESYYVGE